MTRFAFAGEIFDTDQGTGVKEGSGVSVGNGVNDGVDVSLGAMVGLGSRLGVKVGEKVGVWVRLGDISDE